MLHLPNRSFQVISALFVVISSACGESATSSDADSPASMAGASAMVGASGGAHFAGSGAAGASGVGVAGAVSAAGASGQPATDPGLSGSGGASAGRGGLVEMPSTNGGSANGGSANGGSANGGSANGGSANGGSSPAAGERVYVGSTNGQILLYSLDRALGKLTLMKSIAGGSTPSFLAFDPSRRHAYAVNEGNAMVASFSVDEQTGELTLLNRVASGGDAPAFVGVDRAGKYVLVANYNAGTTRVLSIAPDGSLGAPTDNKSPGKNSHMMLTDPANRFAFVMNLGSDTVSQYVFNAVAGTLTPNSVPTVATAKGAGPRHMAFHPNGRFAFVIDELDHTLSAYAYDATLGQLKFLQTLSSLPTTVDGTGNSCAEVVVAPSGNFVYGSNRGHDSIATFAFDSSTGKLTLLGTTPSGGNVPRSFTLSADGKLMLVANESGNVTSFSVDTLSGALHLLSTTTVPPKPQFVGIVELGSGVATL